MKDHNNTTEIENIIISYSMNPAELDKESKLNLATTQLQNLIIKEKIQLLKKIGANAEFVSHDRIDMVGMHLIIKETESLEKTLKELE